MNTTWLLAETNVYYFAAPGGIIIGALIGALIGSTKNRTGLGCVLGGLLGCIGWIIIAVMRRDS